MVHNVYLREMSTYGTSRSSMNCFFSPKLCVCVCVSAGANVHACVRICLCAREHVRACASMWPEGRPGSSDVSPLSGISGLSFDSTFLVILPSPVAYSVFSFWPSLLPTFLKCLNVFYLFF